MRELRSLIPFDRRGKRLGIAFLGILCAALAAPSCVARQGTATVVDTDLGGGLGDLLVLALAVRSPQLDVVGVLTPASPNSERARILTYWLDLLDRPDIKVGEGGDASRPVDLPDSWPKSPAQGPALSATGVLMSALQGNNSSLQALVWGPGSALAASLIEDPSLSSSLIKIVWTRSKGAETPFLSFDRENEVGPVLLDSSCTLVACEIYEMDGIATLNREDWIALGRSRLELTDEMSALAARDRRESESTKTTLEVPHLLCVAAASGLPGATIESRWIEKNEAGEVVFAATGERRISVVKPLPPEDLKGYLLRELGNPSRDFSIDFAHFLKSLLMLDSETKEALKGKLDLTVESEGGEKKSPREKMLEFLEYKLKVLRDRPKASVESTFSSLESAYLEYAGIGWWFPDDFYTDWEFDPSDPDGIQFGVANDQGLPISRVAASLRIGDVSQTQTVESATDTVKFQFDIPPQAGKSVSAVSAELSWRFESAGGPIERWRQVGFSRP